MNKPDILIFMSDQHSGDFNGFAGHESVKTPSLDAIAKRGTVFTNAYTSCPLCVPARMSMLSGQLPSKTGVFTNTGSVPVDQATFIHSLAAEGYETVLCGRMHFVGQDQRHGFTRRIMGDITPQYWGRGGDKHTGLGPYIKTLQLGRCFEITGGGTSPVLEYDRAVINAALEYLKQEHKKPQCLVIGTYAPHFTYVAPTDLYKQYREIVKLPSSFGRNLNYTTPYITKCYPDLNEEVVLSCRAAYMGMITNLDSQIGQVRDAWGDYLARKKNDGIFVYLSDHGDQAGERYLYGKETFFEGSVKIPLLFEGGAVRGGVKVNTPASIMDLGPTLCELSGAEVPPEQDGKSLYPSITSGLSDPDRYIVSEFMHKDPERRLCPARMVRYDKWKYISCVGYEENDLLFDLESDPGEYVNLADEFTEKASELKKLLCKDWNAHQITETYKKKSKHFKILARWGAASDLEENDCWPIPESSWKLPEIY